MIGHWDSVRPNEVTYEDFGKNAIYGILGLCWKLEDIS